MSFVSFQGLNCYLPRQNIFYDDLRFDNNKINFILSASITYISETERFSTSLFQSDV